MNILVYIIICIGLTGLFFYLRSKKDADKTSSAMPEDTTAEAIMPEEKIVGIPPEEKAPLENEEESSDKQVTQNKELVANLHKVLEEDKVFLQPEIHIDDVAKMLLTNRTYITRLMRQEYGLTFIEYVNVARIQYSQSLLYTSNMTLDEIAEKSGFQSTSNYCRAFKRYIGSTPLNWLQQVKPS